MIVADKSTALSSFLMEHGEPLEAFGSAERGLRHEDALAFLGLLMGHGLLVLGFEVWRHVNGKYKNDALATWHSELTELGANHADAMHYISNEAVGPNDVMTIQFGRVVPNNSFKPKPLRGSA